MDSPSDIELLCRLCLVKDQVNIPIFEEQGDIRQIFLKISSCLPVSVSREDNLPKKICDGCLDKLDLLYDFWNTSVNAEKTLLTWLGQAGVKDADETITAVAQQIAKPETQVKVEDHETNVDGGVVEEFEEEAKDEEEPPPKRARRSAAVKAQMTLTNDSDEDEDDDFDTAEPMTKMEDESEESEGEEKDPSYNDVPGTSADDQPGPSGLGKDGADAPSTNIKDEFEVIDQSNVTSSSKTIRCSVCGFKTSNLIHLETHWLFPPKDHFLSCRIPGCLKKFWNQGALFKHMQKDHDLQMLYEAEEAFFSANPAQAMYYCEKCDFKSHHIKNVLDHDRQKHTMWKFRCSFCHENISKSGTIINHLQNVHAVPNQVDLHCKECNLHFYSEHVYKQHYRRMKHVEKFTLKCILCDYMGVETGEFARHVHSHQQHKGVRLKDTIQWADGRPLHDVDRLQCPVCAVVLHRHDIDTHKKLCVVSKQCKHCAKYVCIGGMHKHLANNHPDLIVEEKPPAYKVCEICCAQVNADQFIDHTNNHETFGTSKVKIPLRDVNNSELTKCAQCHLMVYNGYCNEHEKIHKLENNGQASALESNRFTSRRRRRAKGISSSRQIQSKQVPYKPPTSSSSSFNNFECQSSYKTNFSSYDSYLAHKLSENGTSPSKTLYSDPSDLVKCTKCQAIFKSSTSLSEHLNIVHCRPQQPTISYKTYKK